MPEEKDFLIDCMITASELDPDWPEHFLDNDLKVVEVAKHNVPYAEFLEWRFSSECLSRIQELERIGRERFGEDYWMKYRICHFCTSPFKD